ncbi:hypothetical protein B0H10DRAFT_2003913 [Mycena sp. CBHHK59/15]|nr:hypothetical protein B0H10DRAFT_2003913 [Mycena sp. CBHHK59/15]
MNSSPTDAKQASKKGRTPKTHLTTKLTTIHAVHGLLVAVHVAALVAVIKGWSISLGLVNFTLVQTGVTAGLQLASIIIIGGLISLVREIAVDANIRHPPTLGLLHLRLKAWAGLFSSVSANWLYSQSHSTLPDPPGLKKILIFIVCCTLLQISSGSIFATTFGGANTSSNLADSQVEFGRRFGNFDELWLNGVNYTSADTVFFPPPARNAALNMFAARTNDTRYPGLQARLLHDTVNLDNSLPPFSSARVNATLVNVHCSQVSNATINTFTLPFGSTDMKLAQPSPQDGQERFLFRNSTSATVQDAVWINVSMPAPPYWDPQVPGLNIVGYWGFDGLNGIPTQVYFQPWAFPNQASFIGHHQLVMVIATRRAVLMDSTNSTGAAVNFAVYQEPDSIDSHGGNAYIQVVGCTVKAENLTATISAQSRLLDPLTSLLTLIGPEAPHDDHPWDEFTWEGTDGVSSPERQFLLAFTPTSPAYNNTSSDQRSTPVGAPESILAHLLDGRLFSPFGPGPTARNALVNFQGVLERLYTSYLWNVNRLCSSNADIQPYLEYCGAYSEVTWLLNPVQLVLELPGVALVVVKWRAVVSLVACVVMWAVVLSLLHPAAGGAQGMHGGGLLDAARVLGRGSRIPEVVEAETTALKPKENSEKGLVEAILTKRLRYVERDDGLGGYLDVDDKTKAK